jgi:ribonuclease-3
MPRRSAPSRTPQTTSTSTRPDPVAAPAAAGPGALPHTARSLAARLRLPVGDSGHLSRALVHSSYLHEHPDAADDHNERLEYLGDAVVNLVISEALFSMHPDDDEGALSARRASIVSTVGLAQVAERLDLASHLLLGEGEASRGGRSRPALLAAAFEAVAGAIYLELGFDATRSWILEAAGPELDTDLSAGELKSPKSRLQEHTQRATGDRPVYRVLDASGPDHERSYRIVVEVDGDVLGEGTGPSRRAAETAAAVMALETIRGRESLDD